MVCTPTLFAVAIPEDLALWIQDRATTEGLVPEALVTLMLRDYIALVTTADRDRGLPAPPSIFAGVAAESVQRMVQHERVSWERLVYRIVMESARPLSTADVVGRGRALGVPFTAPRVAQVLTWLVQRNRIRRCGLGHFGSFTQED